MFVTSSVNLKIHRFREGRLETLPVETSPSVASIKKISVGDSSIALLRQGEKPQVFEVKDLTNLRLIHTINVSDVTALCCKHNKEESIVLGTKTGKIVMYDTTTRVLSNVNRSVAVSIKDLEFSYDDQHLCGITSNTLVVCPGNNSSQLKRYNQVAECTCVKCHPTIFDQVIIGCKNGHVAVWNIQKGAELIHIEALDSPIFALGMSSCGKYLFAGGKELKVCVLDYETNSDCSQYDLVEEKPVTALDVSRDNKHLAVGLNDGTVKIYDMQEEFQFVESCKAHKSAINCIVFENKNKEQNSLSSEQVAEANQSGAAGCYTCPCRSMFSELFEELKNELKKMMKSELGKLQKRMEEHCINNQSLLYEGFDRLDKMFHERWQEFVATELNQIMNVKKEPAKPQK